MKKPNLITTIVIIVILLLIGAYFYYSGTSAPAGSPGLVQSQTSQNGTLVGSQELSLLNQIRSLHIDTALFSDPAYQTLRDYSVAIPSQDVGRPDPFAPIPGVSDNAPGSSASQTGTSGN